MNRSFILLSLLLFLTVIVRSQVTVTVNKQGNYEIRNGVAGIVLAKQKDAQDKQWPAPVQSFIYNDGTYSDNTPNYLVSPTPPVSMKTTVVAATKDQAIVDIVYDFQKKEFDFYGRKFAGGEAKRGSYHFSVTVRKDDKSIVMEEDADYDISYAVKISHGFSPDQARYRGWGAETLEQGYESPGVIYRSEDTRSYPMDATVDFNFTKRYFFYPLLTLWEPAGGEMNTGRYWQVYNSNAPASGNLFGFFQGKPSRLVGAKSIGPRLRTFAEDALDGEKKIADINISIDRLSPDVDWIPKKRFQWVAYISTKKDLLKPEQVQPIGIEMNRVSGLASVINDYAVKPVKIIPAFYSGAIYMGADKISKLRESVKKDFSFYTKLLQTEGGYQQIWDLWQSPTKARAVIDTLLAIKSRLQAEYISGNGVYVRDYRYWKGSRNFKYYAILISCIFSDKTIALSNAEKAGLENFIGMMARILWNDDNAPMIENSGVNFGPSNMIFQYLNNGRFFFALLLKNDPEFADKANQVLNAVSQNIGTAIAASGSSYGSPHYTQATIEPLLFSILQLKQAGVADLFKTNKKLKLFARFYLNMLTPPSPRFSGNRKLISFGDGSEESAACFGLLATGFAESDPDLSGALAAAYNFGPRLNSFHGPGRFAIDVSTVAKKEISAATSSYNGYVTHYRAGANTSTETAVWMLNGDSLYDHRNDDAGETAIYALGAPLSLSRSSFYYPFASDARIRTVVVPEKLFPEWNGNNQPIAGHSSTNRTWPSSALKEFASLGYSASSTALMKTPEGAEWYRQIMMINLPGNDPIIAYYDSIKGNAPNIWSMTMMSEGPVATPTGNILPEKRVHNNGDLQQLPSGTPVKTINAGINRFAFTGQQWVSHPTGGINWYLYTMSGNSIDFSLADWTTTWQNQTEQEEFYATNKRAYAEEQQIIRMKSTRPFFNLLLPFQKGKDVYTAVQKSRGEDAYQLKLKDQDILVSRSGYYSRENNKIVMASWTDGGVMAADGYRLSGGCIEIELANQKLLIRLHGNAGKRTIVLPLNIQLVNVAKEIQVKSTAAGNVVTINYSGGGPDMNGADKGYTEYVFSVK